jgi:uncharacterized membrane protein YeaQ/YmgE (transglycosylase-associated protein family)
MSPVRGRRPAPHEQLVGLEHLAALEGHAHRAVRVAVDALGPRLEAQVDAGGAQPVLDLLGRERLLAAEHAVAGLDERDLGAERLPRLAELDADDAAAEDDDPPGHPGRVRPLAVVPGAGLGEPRHGQLDGGAAGGHDDRAAGGDDLVADAHAPLAVQARPPAQQRDPLVLEPRHLPAVVEAPDDLVARGEDGRRVELAGHRRRRARQAPRLGERLRGAQEGLRRDARVVRALAADQVLLGDQHLQARLRQAARGHLAGGTGAEHDHVHLTFGHPAVLPGAAGGTQEAVSIIAYVLLLLLSGLVVGSLGRLVIPGPDPMSIPQTIVVGVAGSFLAGLVYWAIFGRNTGGLLLAVAFAAGIVFLIRRSRGGAVQPHRPFGR